MRLEYSANAQAVSRGEFDDLPGAGRPLDLDHDPLVPEDLRLAYRMLKRLAIGDAQAVKKVALLKARIEARYYEKALARLGR